MSPAGTLERDRLRERQRQVLADLLAARTPVGFGPAGAALTTRVLLTKRAEAAERVAPEAREWSAWRENFRAWAAEHPAEGCAHDDVRRFAQSLARSRDAEGRCWARIHEVHEGAARMAVGMLDGKPRFCLAVAGRVWVVPSRAEVRYEKGGGGHG